MDQMTETRTVITPSGTPPSASIITLVPASTTRNVFTFIEPLLGTYTMSIDVGNCQIGDQVVIIFNVNNIVTINFPESFAMTFCGDRFSSYTYNANDVSKIMIDLYYDGVEFLSTLDLS